MTHIKKRFFLCVSSLREAAKTKVIQLIRKKELFKEKACKISRAILSHFRNNAIFLFIAKTFLGFSSKTLHFA